MKGMTLAFVALFALGCGSGLLPDLGDLGDILGSTGSDDQSDVRGTVLAVDTSQRRIDLDVDYVNNLRDDRGDSSIYYDANTVVEYQGNTYRPEDLERGDEISVVGTNQNGEFVADRITVLRDAT